MANGVFDVVVEAVAVVQFGGQKGVEGACSPKQQELINQRVSGPKRYRRPYDRKGTHLQRQAVMGLPFAGPSQDPLAKEQIAQKDHGQNPTKAANLPFIPGFAQVEDPKKSGHQNQVHG